MQLEEEVICHIRCEQGAAVNFWHLVLANVHYKCASMNQTHMRMSACVHTLVLHSCGTCEHMLCECVLLPAAYTWTLLAVELDSRQRAERAVRVLKVRAGYESSVMDEERPSSPAHLHTENGPLTQLPCNNIPQLNPHLSYHMPPILLDCFHLASGTISHISVFPPATSNACRLTVSAFTKTLCLWLIIMSCQVSVI